MAEPKLPPPEWQWRDRLCYSPEQMLAFYRQAWAEAARKCAEECAKLEAKWMPNDGECAAACERVGKEMGE